MASKKRYRFTEKVRSKGGRQSVILALVSLGLFFADALISFGFHGNAGGVAGAVAWVAMLLSVYGFYIGMKSFSEEKKASPVLSVVGSIASGVVAVGWLTIFLTGLGG